MIYYKLFKIIIIALGLATIIIKLIMRYYILRNWIVTNHKSFFTSKFKLSLYYFFDIKRELSITFYL